MSFVLPFAGIRGILQRKSNIRSSFIPFQVFCRSNRIRVRGVRSRVRRAAIMELQKEWTSTDYAKWSHSDLVTRIQQLEASLKNYTQKEPNEASIVETAKPIQSSTFDFSRYTSRLIALKFAYIGRPYQGFEYHAGAPTALPTVEEKLFEALLKARLVPPKVYYNEDGSRDETQQFSGGGGDQVEGGIGKWIDLEKWNYSKCGRTDRGVSAFGQVIGIRVRSNRLRSKKEEALGSHAIVDDSIAKSTASEEQEPSEHVIDENEESAQDFTDADELPYVTILNRLLPSTIRVLAWCPNPPPNFSARFDCKSRTYRYFFTNPPTPPSPGEHPTTLDIPKMSEAASHYTGLHDFRNVCKIDASKQITNFMRRVESASVERVGGILPVFSHSPASNDDSTRILTRRPEVYYFQLTGSAFLWHQVRHMVAILFLIGQSLESPDIVKELLDIEKTATKPFYNMADDRPLVLWDCHFDEEQVKWVYPEFTRAKPGAKEDVLGSIWEMWHNSNMDALLSGGLLAMIYEQQIAARGDRVDEANYPGKEKKKKQSTWVVDGSPMMYSVGKYVPILKRERQEPVDIINEKYAARKSEEWRARWSVEAKKAKGVINEVEDED